MSYYLYDHLGNTRIVFHTTYDCKELDYVAEYVADYYPFGKVLREWVNCEVERYLTTQHERDKETGYDYRGARFYDADLGRFLSVDPLAAEYAAWSTYVYVLDNPVRLVDPDGRAPMGDYYDKRGNYVGSDGINDNKLYIVNTDASAISLGLNLGSTIGRLMANQRDKQTTEVGGLVIITREKDGDDFTIGKVTLVGQGGYTENMYSLEPAGEATTTPNQDRRIPDGVYDIDPYSSTKYPDNFIVSNKDVSKSRKILLHKGNSGQDTAGCILPGCGTSDKIVTQSGQAMGDLRTFIKTTDKSASSKDDVKLIIKN
ncbi:MAG: DUF5675 family protein [Saprospiraceae bacterium]